MTDASIWNEALGPFYKLETLESRGVDTEGLVALRTTDNVDIYPDEQFDHLADGTMQRREAAIQLWQILIAPEIEDGVVDDWTASALLFQRSRETGQSEASAISNDPAQVNRVRTQITDTLSRWRQ